MHSHHLIKFLYVKYHIEKEPSGTFGSFDVLVLFLFSNLNPKLGLGQGYGAGGGQPLR